MSRDLHPEVSEHPVLGAITSFWVSEMMGLPSKKFVSLFGVGGLAEFTDTRLDLIAVHSDNPGHGQFRRFMESCKNHFQEVYVWEISNPWLPKALMKYGFVDTSGKPGDIFATGMVWRKNAQPNSKRRTRRKGHHRPDGNN